jgi:hypothetical protein
MEAHEYRQYKSGALFVFRLQRITLYVVQQKSNTEYKNSDMHKLSKEDKPPNYPNTGKQQP